MKPSRRDALRRTGSPAAAVAGVSAETSCVSALNSAPLVSGVRARRHASTAERLRFASFFLGTLPLQYLRRALRGEQEGVVLKLRGARDALRGRPLPRAELGLDG